MRGCRLCPRECGADRENQKGACGCGKNPFVARAALHMWEEPCISGSNGSGAIFFCGCNLKCVFCQNHEISRKEAGREFDSDDVAELMLRMQDLGAHNVNLVTPSVHALTLVKSIDKAKGNGLKIPVVYNTNAYEKTETLRLFKGLVDIYLPDLKYVSSTVSCKYSSAADYFSFAAPAVMEMFGQCGPLKLSEDGIAQKGLIIRHLVLPGSVDETRKVLDFIASNLPLNTAISLMSQYTPVFDDLPAPLNRKLTAREYDRAVDHCITLGLDNVLIQTGGCCEKTFIPEFNGYYE